VEGALPDDVDVVDDAVRRAAAEREDLVVVHAERRADGVISVIGTEHHVANDVGRRELRGVELGVVELAVRTSGCSPATMPSVKYGLRNENAYCRR
jgi:hypothetical protein